MSKKNNCKPTSPKFNSSPLRNGGWKTILSYWGPVTFQGRKVKEPNTPEKSPHTKTAAPLYNS